MARRRYERVGEPLASRRRFVARLSANGLVALVVIGLSLFAGMARYHVFGVMSWIDAFANAAMILSGMGPLAPMTTFGGKLFAGLYALYSGLVLIAVAALLLTPVAHRLLHRFHVEED